MGNVIMKKRIFYTEIAYIIGIVVLAFGTGLMERADFGLSMVVAPAYLVHLKVSEFLPWFSFGMAEYCLQAVLIVLLSLILRRFRIKYFFSFVTAVFYGLVLDLSLLIISFIPGEGIVARFMFFVPGMLLCAFGVSLLFHTYIPPEAYELIVKEIADTFKFNITRVKTAYDCTSCVISVILSFVFFGFGKFVGVYYGTVVCALLNGIIIGMFSKFTEKRFEFKNGIEKMAKTLD